PTPEGTPKPPVVATGVSNQSARTATSSNSPTGNSWSEWMSSHLIAREESEPVRVNETHEVSWNPPDLSVG
ncbi:MAG: hypothetical protein ACREPR_26450, partial [Brasilonema sp.]